MGGASTPGPTARIVRATGATTPTVRNITESGKTTNARLSPVVTPEKKDRQGNDCWAITEDCLNPKNFLVKYADFDVVEDKYMAISLN